jgi:hypothetical protein
MARRYVSHKLPVWAGSTAAVALTAPVLLWWTGDGQRCSGFGRVVTLSAVTAGLVIAVLAMPVGMWLMIGHHRWPWLAAPVGLVGVATVVVGESQIFDTHTCFVHDTLTRMLGFSTVIGGVGLLGLTMALLRPRQDPS